ncbi:MAG: hypothetical protein K5793_04045 [Nitrosarchaeum sp.]|nr:hypothetical protein [Nitrosarchaeum sp.]MCV0398791.1 hypothetical protein [Nitrosarchaeum sp.]
MAVLTQNALDEILIYLEKSIVNMSKDMLNNSEFHMDAHKFDEFISDQFDIRLENLLKAKDSSIHHLESGMKNRIIQRKRAITENINI